MPPKKSFQLLLGQKKLSFGGKLHTNEDEPKSVPESESVASTSDNDSEIPSAVVVKTSAVG